MLTTKGLPQHMMPRDVATRWNSTYDMLDFSVQYQTAIDAMMAICDFDLRKYKLIPAEWKIAEDLREILKVSGYRTIILLFYPVLQDF
jgi:hypothetical protein